MVPIGNAFSSMQIRDSGRAIEADALLSDWDFYEVGGHIGVEPMPPHAPVLRYIENRVSIVRSDERRQVVRGGSSFGTITRA